MRRGAEVVVELIEKQGAAHMADGYARATGKPGVVLVTSCPGDQYALRQGLLSGDPRAVVGHAGDARRGYNIDSLVVSEGHDPAFSHMNITATGDGKTLQQNLQQLNRLVDVIHAKDHTGDDIIQRELALIKLHCTGDTRNEILQIAHVFKCPAVNLTDATITLEVTGETEKIDALHRMLDQYGILEMVRTGHVSIARGEETTY